MVSTLDGESRFCCESEFVEAGVLNRDASAEYHGHAYARSRAQPHHPRYSRPPCSDAGLRSSLAARNGSRGNRDANCSGEISAANGKQNTARPWEGGIPAPRVG